METSGKKIDQARRSVKNFLFMAGSEFLSRVCGLMLVIVLARYLGPEGYGIYSLSFAYYSIFLLISNLGIDTVVTKNLARDMSFAGSYISQLSMTKFVLSTACILVISGIAFVAGYSEITKLGILVLSISIYASSQIDLVNAVFYACERMEYPSVVNVLRSILSLCLILLIVWMGFGVLLVLSAQLVSILACYIMLVMAFRYKVYTVRSVRLVVRYPKEIVQESIAFFFVAALFILNTRLDMLMISWFKGEKGVGIYAAAAELMNILLIIPGLISRVLFPQISRNFVENKEMMIRVANTGIKMNVLTGFPIGVGLFILAPRILDFVFGAKYADAGVILKILAANVVIFYGLSMLSWVLSATENVRTILVSSGISVGLNVALNLALIPLFGLVGAAMSSVTCTIFRTLFLGFVKERKFPEIRFFSFYMRPIIASFVMGLVVIGISDFKLLWVILTGACVYVAAIIVLGGFTESEKEMIMFMIRNRLSKSPEAHV